MIGRCDMRELQIAALGAQGDGIAKPEGETIFVPFALPSELVRAEVDGASGRLIEVVSPSADRAEPVCRHFGVCGGCVAQHMAPELYQQWKRQIVVDAFARAGLETDIAPLVTVPTGSRRRAVFSSRKWETGVILGFHRMGSETIEPIRECPVLSPAIVSGLSLISGLCGLLLKECRGVRCTALASPIGLELSFESETGRIGAANRSRFVELAAGKHLSRVTLDGDVVLAEAKPMIRFGVADVVIPPGVFVQAVAEAEAAMAERVLEAAGKGKQVADLFCGVGTFALRLARRARVFAVDSDQAAIGALVTAARLPGLKPIETRVRDLLREPLSAKELDKFDVVVFDPPRAGAKAQAEMLAKSKVKTVVAVSCNPATLARDARILTDGGYQIGQVTPIDQFVYSAHVEVVAVLSRG